MKHFRSQLPYGDFTISYQRALCFFYKTVMLKSVFRFFDRARRARQSLAQPSRKAS
jgi:hypothetical protein